MKLTILKQWVEDSFAWVEAFDDDTGEIYVLTGYLQLTKIQIKWQP